MQQLKEQFFKLDRKMILSALIIPLIVAAIFSYIFSNNQIIESKVAIIDLDNSNYSRQLIDKMDASPYIAVNSVYNKAIEPDQLLYNEKNLAVFSLPKGLESNVYRGAQTNVGFLVDYAVMSSSANLRAAASEIFSNENISLSVSKLKNLGFTSTQATGLISNLSLQQRLLYNPTGDYINTTVFGFFNVVILVLLTTQTVKIIPTLRQEGILREKLKNPISIIFLVLPYSILYGISLILSLGILKQLGGLRFTGNFLEFLLPLFLYTFASGLLGMLTGWSAKEPAKASIRLILIVMPSFMLSNLLFSTNMMPKPLQILSHFFPLNWYFKFFREIGLRGAPFSYIKEDIGGFLILIAVFILLLFINIFKTYIKESEKVFEIDYTEEKVSKSYPNLLYD